ncbi:TniQ family protein [uncultured Photobacterium sp.]|uniref:TniQ family protein n=1 Tax=uncultured Photobacterium sp. TaxID=173973 RepID=UPI002630B639|nr:TniQ family protein [uncultured Photobacterium sp.]
MEFGVRNIYSLAVRLAPLQGESIKSFLMRLAIANACKYKDLIKHLGFGPNVWFTPGSRSESKVYTELSRVLNVSEGDLLNVLRTPYMKELWVPSVKGTSEMKIRSIRVCVGCLLEALYHRQAWQHALYCVCSKHNELLIDVCPQCGEDLVLATSHSGRCGKCASHITEWTVSKVEVPHWQSQVFRGSRSRELLISLLKMSMIAVRPLDVFTSDIRIREMRITEIMVLMQKAWFLLYSHAERQALKEELESHWYEEIRVLGDELALTLYREAQALALADELSRNGSKSSVFTSASRALNIIKSTKHFALLYRGNDAADFVRATQLTHYLGVAPADFKQLKLSGVFIPVNPEAAKKDALYSLENVARKVSMLNRTNSVAKGYIPYCELVPSACKFIPGVTAGDVLVDVFNNKLPAQLLTLKKGSLISRLYINKQSFFEKYDEDALVKEDEIPVEYLPAYWGTKMPNVREALKSEFILDIIDMGSESPIRYIPMLAIKELNSNYLILNKWAFLHAKSKVKCLCALKRAKIEPLVRVNEENCNSFEIYPKSAEQVLLERYDELT